MKRIICIGNRYDPADAAGPRVYDALTAMSLPDDVEVIDGGLAGLNLLRFVEGAQKVVFVDTVVGFGHTGEVMLLDPALVTAGSPGDFSHASGLPYLLRVAQHACQGPAAEVALVGLEAVANEGAITTAAALSRELLAAGSDEGQATTTIAGQGR